MPRRLLDTASACRGSPWPVRPRRRVRTFRTRTWIRVRFSFQGSREMNSPVGTPLGAAFRFAGLYSCYRACPLCRESFSFESLPGSASRRAVSTCWTLLILPSLSNFIVRVFLSNHSRVSPCGVALSTGWSLLSSSFESRLFNERCSSFEEPRRHLAAPFRCPALYSANRACPAFFVVAVDFIRRRRRLIHLHEIHFSPGWGKAVQIDCQRTSDDHPGHWARCYQRVSSRWETTRSAGTTC